LFTITTDDGKFPCVLFNWSCEYCNATPPETCYPECNGLAVSDPDYGLNDNTPIVSDENGNAISLITMKNNGNAECLQDPPMPEHPMGCFDPDGCNYISNNIPWLGVYCEYPPEDECDCDGNTLDCYGNCGGPFEFDDCGVCGGDGSWCSDCLNIPCNNEYCESGFPCEDQFCHLFDCAGVCGGGHVEGIWYLDNIDGDGICCTDSFIEPGCILWGFGPDGYIFEPYCDGFESGELCDCTNIDDCGICEGDNSTCADCAGTPYGDLVVDICGVCGGTATNMFDCINLENVIPDSYESHFYCTNVGSCDLFTEGIPITNGACVPSVDYDVPLCSAYMDAIYDDPLYSVEYLINLCNGWPTCEWVTVGSLMDTCDSCGGCPDGYECCWGISPPGAVSGDLLNDECGVCDGDGIQSWACDCDGNVEDCKGVCGGTSYEDIFGECCWYWEKDECNVCGGDGYTYCERWEYQDGLSQFSDFTTCNAYCESLGRVCIDNAPNYNSSCGHLFEGEWSGDPMETHPAPIDGTYASILYSAEGVEDPLYPWPHCYANLVDSCDRDYTSMLDTYCQYANEDGIGYCRVDCCCGPDLSELGLTSSASKDFTKNRFPLTPGVNLIITPDCDNAFNFDIYDSLYGGGVGQSAFHPLLGYDDDKRFNCTSDYLPQSIDKNNIFYNFNCKNSELNSTSQIGKSEMYKPFGGIYNKDIVRKRQVDFTHLKMMHGYEVKVMTVREIIKQHHEVIGNDVWDENDLKIVFDDRVPSIIEQWVHWYDANGIIDDIEIRHNTNGSLKELTIMGSSTSTGFTICDFVPKFKPYKEYKINRIEPDVKDNYGYYNSFKYLYKEAEYGGNKNKMKVDYRHTPHDNNYVSVRLVDGNTLKPVEGATVSVIAYLGLRQDKNCDINDNLELKELKNSFRRNWILLGVDETDSDGKVVVEYDRITGARPGEGDWVNKLCNALSYTYRHKGVCDLAVGFKTIYATKDGYEIIKVKDELKLKHLTKLEQEN